MHRLGVSSSQPSDWSQSKAFYLRLTIVPSTRVSRPENQFPRPRVATKTGSKDVLIMRHELLDLGHVQTYEELCKYYFDRFVPFKHFSKVESSTLITLVSVKEICLWLEFEIQTQLFGSVMLLVIACFSEYQRRSPTRSPLYRSGNWIPPVTSKPSVWIFWRDCQCHPLLHMKVLPTSTNSGPRPLVASHEVS